MKIARLGPGCVVKETLIEASADLSAVNFTIGTESEPAKYGAAIAGPAANGAKIVYPPLARKLDANARAEDVFLFPSAAIAGAGAVRTTLRASHR
ncbi:hypothetical protein [Croceicoccus sp. YJ47]|uniref:hypothetical protein n=1 Tax=Croceicoccus sp. YJ47 TaxID=2798724 RepID=UPI0019243EBD|nr:hypothetical protein [Croceicoccus sp. YJ47]QQN75041.1 hypothetical protein JD971_04915 [Croceicoccus sp. YJ47]